MEEVRDRIKHLLLSLYESSKPQPFTQIHAAYNKDKHTIKTTMTRIYDLRAGAPVQILFADGISTKVAIEFLQRTIRDLEHFGLSRGKPNSLPTGLLPHEIREELDLDVNATDVVV